jgi:hypothetical protein
MSHYIIRKIHLAHCKKGPAVCEKCREMNVEKICLLDIDPPHPGEIQRRVIQVNVDGQTVWREFDIVQTFASAEAATRYAQANVIGDVSF